MKSRKNNWKPFKIGEPIAGVTILAIKEKATSQKDFIYKGKYTCCGATTIISHLHLIRRQRKKQENCFHCRKPWGKIQNTENEPLLIPLPLWPVPGQKK